VLTITQTYLELEMTTLFMEIDGGLIIIEINQKIWILLGVQQGESSKMQIKEIIERLKDYN
jgi:hypothetical protein